MTKHMIQLLDNYLLAVYQLNHYNDLESIINITPQKYSDSKSYIDFYYNNAATYFGIVYNFVSDTASSVRPILFTLIISYDGIKMKFIQINEIPGATLNVNKAYK